MSLFKVRRNIARCGMLALLLAAVLVFGALRAEAHCFIVRAEGYSVPVGAKIGVWVSLSEPLAGPGLSIYGFTNTVTGKVVYVSGKTADLGSFSYYNTKDPSNTNPASADVQRTEATIEEGGTALIGAKLEMSMMPMAPAYFVGYSKYAVNPAADGVAQKPIGGGDVLEVVPVGDLNAVTAGTALSVRVFFKGQPLANCEIGAAYDGAPVPAGEEQNLVITGKTDASGFFSLTPDRAGLWATEAGHETVPASPQAGVRDVDYYGASLLFQVSSGSVEFEEIGVTDLLVTQANNRAGVEFGAVVDGVPEVEAFMGANNMIMAHHAVSAPNGSTAPYTVGPNQLSGDSGFSFDIPVPLAGGKSALVGVEAMYVFTPDNLGQTTFDRMVERVKALPTVSSGGMTFVIPDPGSLLPDLGLGIYAKYPDGAVREITALVQYGLEISQIGAGIITMVYGGMTSDHDASASQLSLPFSLAGGAGSVLYDGKQDGTLTGTWYIARRSNGGGGSGCDSGFGALALLGGAVVLRRTVFRRNFD